MQRYQPRNIDLLESLERLRHYADITGAVYREKAYRKAMSSIRKLDYDILDDAERFHSEKLPGIGKGIGAKIDEYIDTGAISEIKKLARDPRVKAYEELSRVVGVGPATIERWYGAGISSLASLRRAVREGRVTLNHMQMFGLKYVNDLSLRIPRAEVTSISRDIRRLLTNACRTRTEATGLLTETAGSYRRGAETSGDIDILVSSRKFRSDYLLGVHELIKTRPEYITTLSTGEQRLTFLWRPEARRGGQRQYVRQIDILYMPRESYHAAILYFTGSADFNEYMRGRLKARGYRLNQMGLYKSGKPVPVEDERDIFQYADMTYVSPARR